MIHKTNSNYFHTICKLCHDRNNLIQNSSRKLPYVSPIYFIVAIYLLPRNDTFLHIFLFFQRATGGIESAVYKKLIAPFVNDLPSSHMAGFRRVCVDHKYAFIGPNILNLKFTLLLPCKLLPLPEPSYKGPWAFIISKNSPYKGLINWRWDN